MKPLPRPLGTLAFLMAWFVPWRPAYAVRAGASNLTFHLHYRDAIGRHIAKYGTHEPLLTHWFADYLAAAGPGIVVDVGANIGWHALHAAKQAGVETVVAFEPEPFNAWLLDRNLSANGIDNVIVNASAVGAKPGIARLYRYKGSNFGRHTIVADHGFGSRAVPVTDLDGALERLDLANRRVSVIKIDVEGYEPAVIAGALGTLARTDVVIVEYSPDLSRAGGLSTAAMLTQLRDAGLTPFVLRSDGGVVRIDYRELDGFVGTVDVLFARPERWTPEVAKAMNERERGSSTLLELAEQNKLIVTER